ncbi:hypothetical protein PG994_009250 [Apiospora phragmitis]|uniref:SprT-like domain-containing protein n=1 Tax=Apiospora phragmitis TaxID=2905665 RepID=A0ABR1UIR8_9PEZI
MSPRSASVMTEPFTGLFDDVYHLYTYTTKFFSLGDNDDTTAPAEAGMGLGTTTPKPKPSYNSGRGKFHIDYQHKVIIHILHSWERTALHQYADYEVRTQLVRDLRRLYECLDILFFEGMLRLKYRCHGFRTRPCERVRLDIFESMPSAWCGGLRRYLGVRRHAFSSGGCGSGLSKRCRGLSCGGGGGNGFGVGRGCCRSGDRNGREDEDENEEEVEYDEHPGATVWTSLLCRSAKSLRRRRRLRIGLVLRSPDDGGHYSIEHLVRALVHEMCHAYVEKMWEAAWPAADYEAFVRHGGDGHGVLWQALCWKVLEEIESWGVDSAQGLCRQEPMLADLALSRAGVLRMPAETEAIFRSLGPGLV